MSLLTRIAKSNGEPQRTIEALRLINVQLVCELNQLDRAIGQARNLSHIQRRSTSDRELVIKDESLNLEVLRCC